MILQHNSLKGSLRTLKKKQENLTVPLIIESLEDNLSRLSEVVISLEMQFAQVNFIAEELRKENKRLSNRVAQFTEVLTNILNATPELLSVQSITSQLKSLLNKSLSQKSGSDQSEETSKAASREKPPQSAAATKKEKALDPKAGVRYPSLVLDLPAYKQQLSNQNPVRLDSMENTERVPAIQTQINMSNFGKVGSNNINLGSFKTNENQVIRPKRRSNSLIGSSKLISRDLDGNRRKIDRKRVVNMTSNNQVTAAYNPIPRHNSSITKNQEESSQRYSSPPVPETLIRLEQMEPRKDRPTSAHREHLSKLGYEMLLTQDLEQTMKLKLEEETPPSATLSEKHSKLFLKACALIGDFSDGRSDHSGGLELEPGAQKKSFF